MIPLYFLDTLKNGAYPKKGFNEFCIYMKSVILIGLTTLASASIIAQPGNRGIDNSSRQVTTKFEPKLIPSSKLVLDPIVPRSENPKINVKFETPEFAWNTRKIIRPVQPEKLKDKSSDSVYLSNYARIGGGNYGHILGEVYLSSKANPNYSYNFSGIHLNANPANSIREFSTNKFQLQGAKYFQNSGLETKIFYNIDKINFFAKDSAYDNPTIINSGKISNHFGLGVDYDLIAGGKRPSIHTGIAAQAFNTGSFGQKEMDFSGYLNASHRIKNVTWGADLSTTYLDMQQKPDTNKFNGLSTNKQLFIDALPYVKFNHQPTKLDVKFGVLLTNWTQTIDTQKTTSKFYVNPYLEVEKTLTGLNLKLYGGIDGGLKKNSFRRMNSYMPFTGDSVSIKNTYEQFNGYLGIKGKITENAEFALDFGGNSSSNFALVVSRADSMNVAGKKKSMMDSLGTLQFIYADVNSVYFRSMVKYKVGEQLKLSANAKVISYNVDRNDYAWHLPSLTYGVNGQYYLGKSIEIQCGLDGVSKRRNQVIVDGKPQTKEMPGYMDIHARLDYRLSGKGRIWIQGSNLLNNQYQQWYGYKNYGLTVMGGLSLSLF
ncbi:MAG: hypothetical protein RL062_433 [Bacteroidota bacterium]